MRVLVTGSSGQIGTNLALRLTQDGHEVFGVDKRQNTWTRRTSRTCCRISPGHYPAFPGGIGGVEYPEVDLVVHLAAHAKVHQLVRQPHRALENAIMTFNVLEYCRAPSCRSSSPRRARSTATCTASRSTARRRADFAYTESPYSASKITSEAFIYSYAQVLRPASYLVFRFSNVYGRYDNDLARMERVLPLFIAPALARRADHRLRRRATRCSTSPTSTTASRDRARRRAARQRRRSRTRRSTSRTGRATRSCARPS